MIIRVYSIRQLTSNPMLFAIPKTFYMNCNITGLLTEIQCKSKRLRKNFKQKNSFYSSIKVEEEGVDKLVSSTTRSGKVARLTKFLVSLMMTCFA